MKKTGGKPTCFFGLLYAEAPNQIDKLYLDSKTMLCYSCNKTKHCYERERMDKISKKELLAQTGISYGQLYRWKREGLIPEEWFIKQSAFTGQETFFPKDQIMERVAFILREKDSHSLEELAGMLAADGGDLRISAAELENMRLFSVRAWQAMEAMKGCGEYTLWEAALLAAAARAAAECGIPEKDLACFFKRSLSLKQTWSRGNFPGFFHGRRILLRGCLSSGEDLF